MTKRVGDGKEISGSIVVVSGPIPLLSAGKFVNFYDPA
jgi:hypothetical protein